MAVELISAVLDRSEAEGTDRLVLVVLAEHANKDTFECWPSVRRLALRCRVSERTVQRSIRSLGDLGELRVVPRPGRSTRYRLSIPDPRQPDTPDDLSPPTPVSPGGDNCVTPPPTPVSPEPSMNRQGPTPMVNGARADAVAQEFAAIWDAYPRKVGKQKAQRTYWVCRRSGVDADALLAAVQHYAADVQARGTDARYVLHAATFFGPDRRWEEWVEPPQAPAVVNGVPPERYR